MTTNTPADEMLRLLQEKDQRIAELEAELQQARQLQQKAEEGWDAAHQAAMHYMNEGCANCEELESKLQEALQRIAELESLAGDLRLGQGRLLAQLGIHGLYSRNDMQDILDAVLAQKSKLQEAEVVLEYAHQKYHAASCTSCGPWCEPITKALTSITVRGGK